MQHRPEVIPHEPMLCDPGIGYPDAETPCGLENIESPVSVPRTDCVRASGRWRPIAEEAAMFAGGDGIGKHRCGWSALRPRETTSLIAPAVGDRCNVPGCPPTLVARPRRSDQAVGLSGCPPAPPGLATAEDVEMAQQRSATAQSFQEPNHSRFGVPFTSQTMSQTKLARVYGPPPTMYGRIISLSSCSTMWQCQT